MKKFAILQQEVPSRMVEAAKRLRADQTEAENILWQRLRNSRLNGLKFRRQQIIGPYIVDFYCRQAGLIIELDGGYHDEAEQRAADQLRTQYLSDLGLRILHIQNSRVTKALNAVLNEIDFECKKYNAR